MDNYSEGYALGARHRARGRDYSLPFGKHVDFVSGYSDGFYGRDFVAPTQEV